MKCPHCQNELELRSYVIGNVDAYGNSVLAKAQCCGKPVRVLPVRAIRVVAVMPNVTRRTEDDWGDPFTK